MVFAVGNDNYGLTDVFLLTETMHRKVQSLGNVCSLSGNERGVDVLQEHFGRDVVAGDG